MAGCGWYLGLCFDLSSYRMGWRYITADLSDHAMTQHRTVSCHRSLRARHLTIAIDFASLLPMEDNERLAWWRDELETDHLNIRELYFI